MNKVTVIGRISNEPELRYTSNNKAICSFNVAIDRGKDRDGNDQGADFPRVQCFGKTAENLTRYSGKGLRVAIEGKIRTGSYTNSKGDKVYTTDISADRIEFLDFKEKKEGGFDWNNNPAFEAVDDNDLPF